MSEDESETGSDQGELRRRLAKRWAGIPREDRLEALAEEREARAQDPQRRRSCRSVAEGIAHLTDRTFAKRGLASADLAMKWREIIGPMLAEVTLPIRISYPRRQRDQGTLYIRCAGGGYVTQIQHLTPLILEKINSFFGYAAVSSVKIEAGVLPRPLSRKAERQSATPAEAERIGALVKSIENDDLRAALDRLGRAIAVRNREKEKM